MTIPKSFQLFGRNWKVEQPNKIIIEGESVLGHCNADNAIIQLRRNMKKELKEITFYHELVHAILFDLEYIKLSNDEVLVERFGKALHQALTTMKDE